ncbi:MAG: glycosyltransferase [Actinomycetota bacterium]|nr:glycosyltransferase [Actinomycetota bacterium]
MCTRFLLGGSEQRLRDIVTALPDHEHHLVVGAESDIELARRQLPEVEVRCEPSLRRALDPVNDFVAIRRLSRIMRRGGYTAVVTHQSKAGVLGRMAARSAGGVQVVHSLSMASFGPGYQAVESGLYRFVERHLEPWTTAYAVSGSDLAERFAAIGVPRSKLSIIRSAARLPAAAATDRAALRDDLAGGIRLSADRPWILYLGSLDERKNVLSLPVFLQQVIQLSLGPRPALVVAGTGPLRSELTALVERVGLADDVRFLGYVDDPSGLLAAADALVLLSRAEGLPQVLLQAAAVGTPFVATEVDGVDELLALGARGTVVDQHDIVGAARAALPYLRWPTDQRGPNIDVSSWASPLIRNLYAQLFETVLAPAATTTP